MGDATNLKNDQPRNKYCIYLLYISSLRVMCEIGISHLGHKKLLHRTKQEGKSKLLTSRRKLNYAQKDLEEGMEYVVDGDVIRLQSVATSVLTRLKNALGDFGSWVIAPKKSQWVPITQCISSHP
jgi:hypothetical protein